MRTTRTSGQRASLTWRLALFALALFVTFATACSRGSGENCDPGQAQCACDTSGGCVDGYICKQDRCAPSCELGAPGCGCIDGMSCKLSESGEQLACVDGACAAAPCRPGRVGCACDESACDDGAECSSSSGVERCEVPACELGALGCGCQLDRTCSAGLVCVQGLCAQLDCAPGELGCACSSSFTCDANLECALEQEQCAPAGTCTPGNLGCECADTELSCVGALECIEGRCQELGCQAGLEGCACLNDECGEAANGDLLECIGGICERSGCAPGEPGCACLGGTSCVEVGTSCTAGVCVKDECIPGSLDCECLAGGCNVGLYCQDDTVCIDNTGRTSGPCKSDGTCNRNNRCDASLDPAVCVRCELGAQGCQCRDDDSCAPGLTCSQGICAGDETVHDRRVPTDPSCHTPCSQDLIEADGTRRVCSSEGLIQGCLDDMICEQGSCIDPGDERAICYSDTNCPDFQQCIQGYCYSDCDTDSDCGAGLGCHKKVCRQQCSLSRSDCPSSMQCESNDGQNGYCVASATSAPMPQEVPAAGEAGSTLTRIELSSTALEQQIELQNNSDGFVTFTLEKHTHRVTGQDGASESVRLFDLPNGECVGAACPMWWLEVGEEGGLSRDLRSTYRAVPNCMTRARFDRAQAAHDAAQTEQERMTHPAPNPADRCPLVTLRQPSDAIDASRWRGTLRVSSPLGQQTIKLQYTERPEGRWAGKMVYFANFDDSGIDTYVDESGVTRTGWLGRHRDAVLARDGVNTDAPVSNGLLQRWGAFRNGNIPGGWTEIKAMLTATEVEQWRWPTTVDACPVNNGACYLYSDGVSTGAGTRVYVTSTQDSPIPTGVTTFPMAINLFTPDDAAPQKLTGRVVSDIALHYAGYPHVGVEFEADPSSPATCDPDVRSNCVNFLKTAAQGSSEVDGLELALALGGRYKPTNGEACAPGYVRRDEPWLIPGFLGDAVQEPSSSLFSQTWCEDIRLPDYDSDISKILAEARIENSSLARANPIPNGNVLPRRVELLDGAMIDQSELFILFRERYPSFVGGDDLVAYGYLLLARKPVDIDDESDSDGDGIPDPYDGAVPPETVSQVSVNGLECSAEILSAIDMIGVDFTNANHRDAVIERLIQGRDTGGSSSNIIPHPTSLTCDSGSAEIVHYVCVDTGLFNGGPNNTSCWGKGGANASGGNDDSCSHSTNGICEDGGVGSTASTCALGTDLSDCGWRYVDARTECPAGSDVVFFTAPASRSASIRNDPCQQSGTCLSTLEQWVTSGSGVIQIEPVWTCDDNRLSCDNNPFDRRDGKVFYKASADDVFFAPLRADIEDAFRYKTQFVGREGTSLGFTPDICVPYSSSTPYCYDPDKIEQLRDRVDCLLALHRDHYASENQNAALFEYLEENFAARYEPSATGGLPDRYDGFERLNAELLIMLGDDAFTSAFESRFDLAANSVAGFEGGGFEDGGLSLSGISGYEMYRLHQAVQYYSMVLERFYTTSDAIAAVLESGASPDSDRNYLSNETVTLYFDRLVRASTQRARALSEIARRYQNFNRPDLARRVALRAYTSTYLESIALANIVSRLSEITGGAASAQLISELERGQRRYRMALLDLVNVYQSITNDVNVFGFSPDYIPFPALADAAGTSTNAFEKVAALALSKLDIARQREQAALAQTRQFDTDEAVFQAELSRLNRTYENQLGEICGVFTSELDGRVYPAIEKYAFHDERLSVIGSPCGFAGNGAIHSTLGQLDLAALDVEGTITQMHNVHERVRLESERVEKHCDVQVAQLEFQYKIDDQFFTLSEDMQRSQETIQWAQKATSTASALADAVKCENKIECITGAVSAGIIVAANVTEGIITGFELEKQRTLREEQHALKQELGEWQIDNVCNAAKIDLNASTQTLLLDLRSLEIALLAGTQRTQLLLSEVSKLRQQARRIELEQQEALELSVNVEAAKNDPNVRIYRNDSVINAEIAFDDALREAYRLTLVYQYYTSQSYAALEQLFLIRMVSSGDYNLENYIYELRNAFTAFEEEFGNPDVRVEVISLRDYIMRIPRLAEDGSPVPIDARARSMRERLLDPSMLDSSGYITIPFSTDTQRLSPLTRNHKILYVEANIEGNSNGDYLGRLYLRQAGTSTINTVGDETLFYRFPERTAVLNPFFNSTREFASSPEVYRSYRLRDRPLINNNWELVINQRDEVVNQDIDLNALTDIKLYIYYTDFTVY